MYLSRLKHADSGVRTRRVLADPYQMHRLLWRAFPDRTAGGPGRVLYRTEQPRLRGAVVTLVQSEKEPDWRPLEREGLLQADCKLFNPEFRHDQRLRFRLHANPVRRVSDRNDKLFGKRVGVFGEDRQREWLQRKALESGFQVIEMLIAGRGVIENSTSGEVARYFAVDFDGTLHVTEPGLLLNTLQRGIGPAKAFGFGLLSLAPL